MNLIKAYSSWRRYRDTVNELGRLSERRLADIGLSRNDIHAAARRAR